MENIRSKTNVRTFTGPTAQTDAWKFFSTLNDVTTNEKVEPTVIGEEHPEYDPNCPGYYVMWWSDS